MTSTLAMQAEIVSGTTHTMVWLPCALKPTKGMHITLGHDPTVWEIQKLYPLCKQTIEDMRTDWKVGGLH